MNNPLHKTKRPVQIGSRASLCINPNVYSMPAALVNCEWYILIRFRSILDNFSARLVKNSASSDIEDIDLGDVEVGL